MNQEERRLKRQKDTRNAVLVLILFVAVVVLLAAGIIYGVNRVLSDGNNNAPDKTGYDTETESEETEFYAETETQVVDESWLAASEFVSGMTLEDKVAQLFVITPDALVDMSGVTAAGSTTKNAYQDRPVGGIIYMASNLTGTEQTSTMLSNMQTIATERTGLPAFFCVDEEGGTVARIAGNSAFGVTDVGDMADIGATGDSQNAYNAGLTIGRYLSDLGFNVDFAPVADVITNDDSMIGNRSFGSDASTVADMVSAELRGLSENNIYGVVKHFPGHGAASGDSHDGAATAERTLEELTATELVPFQRAIDEGVNFVMVGHISLPLLTGDDTPAAMSRYVITDVLRDQMGYDGIVITDAMNMSAITDNYSSGEAAIAAITVGADLILMPEDYSEAYDAVLMAVKTGTITEERLDEAVTRIVRVKQTL